jgi:hypothetical protein
LELRVERLRLVGRDPAARRPGDERLTTGVDRPLDRVAVLPRLVAGVPQVHLDRVAHHDGHPVLDVPGGEAESLGVEGDRGGDVGDRKGRDDAGERHGGGWQARSLAAAAVGVGPLRARSGASIGTRGA